MKQDQRAGDGGIAIQSAGDTNINQGITPEQMKQIIETVAAQVPIYAAMAREIVEVRLTDFEQRLMERFEDSRANADAFKDPDFQYLLGRAQHAYARSGDDDIGSLLADLIVERSKSKQRDRLALTLNQAVEVAATLTINEYAELAFCYIFSRTMVLNLTSLSEFYKILNNRIDPYVDDISRSPASYSYLEAQRCANVGMMMSDFHEILIQNYPGFFMKGISRDEIMAVAPNINIDDNAIIRTSVHDATKFQPNSMYKDGWDNLTSSNGVDTEVREAIWAAASSKIMNKEEIIEAFGLHVPRIVDAFDVWENTPVHSLQLTSVGLAIGHAYATKSGFQADLSIWIN